MRGPRNLKFGGVLGNMLQYGHVKFGGIWRFLTFNVAKKKAKNAARLEGKSFNNTALPPSNSLDASFLFIDD